jgi:hypothetical protein
VNVGAGAGSYEPKDRDVIAVEPSETMIRQRPQGAAPVVRASAMSLPFRDARRCVVLTWEEPSASPSWLTRDYFPEILAYDRTVFPPAASHYGSVLRNVVVRPLLIPHDCTDGFLEAYWRRPESYFDPQARLAISSFARLGDLESGLTALRRDLDDGTWARRNEALMNETELDLGYRLVVGERV